MASFWSLWIIVLTSVTIVAMTWLLLGNRKRKEPTTEKTTGHNYDGIEELDNPLPAWWFYMFLITIIWGVGYLVIYPGMGNYPGLLGWTQVAQHDAEVAAAEKRYRAERDRYLALPVDGPLRVYFGELASTFELSGQIVDGQGRGIANVVITIEVKGEETKVADKPFVMDQRNSGRKMRGWEDDFRKIFA